VPYVGINISTIEENLTLIMPKPALLQVSARTGAGIDRWVRWLGGVGRVRAAPCATGFGGGLV
jgi:hypothetical protein